MSKVSEQFILPLPVRSGLGRDDFYVAPCNALAVQQLDFWQKWPFAKLALIGPTGAGKTHLGHVWAAQTGAKIVDALDIDLVDLENAPAIVVEGAESLGGNGPAQEQLFHLHNTFNASKRPLLLTGRTAPARWKIELLDLVSRLSAIPVVNLESPDDTLLRMMMVKLFADRQVTVGPELIAYLLKHMNRSYGDAVALVQALDKAAFSQKRPLTVPLARQILAGMNER